MRVCIYKPCHIASIHVACPKPWPYHMEWEGEVVVTYFRGAKGLEMRRYLREGDNGAKQMCVEFQMPHKSGTPVTVLDFVQVGGRYEWDTCRHPRDTPLPPRRV